MQSSIVHIEEAARELAVLAEREGLAFLGYLLRMAAKEADELNVKHHLAVAKGGQFEDCQPSS